MKTLCIVLLLGFVLLATGCPRTTPVKPAVVAKVAEYELDQLDTNLLAYDCAMFGTTVEITESTRGKGKGKGLQQNINRTCADQNPDPDKAKRIRDATIHRLIRTIDHVYFQFENELYIKRTTGSFLADVIDLGANFAATITNGERAKTIINAAIIGFQGGRKSGSIHFFQEKTAEALISSMQSSRNKVLADMLTRLREENCEKYSLDEALGDTIEYFYAGTLPRALQELQQNASKIAADTKEDVRIAIGLTEPGVITKADVDVKRESKETLDALSASLAKTDEKTAASDRVKKIVEEMKKDTALMEDLTKHNVTDQTTVEDIIKELRKIKRDKSDASDEEGLTKLNKLIIKFGKLSKTEDNQNG